MREVGPARSWEAAYLAGLRRCGVASQAAEMAGTTMEVVRRYEAISPRFAARAAEARADAADVLEAEAWRRAVFGIERTVYYGGEAVGVERVYSDRLLLALLKAYRPALFGGAVAAAAPEARSLPKLREVVARVFSAEAQ